MWLVGIRKTTAPRRHYGRALVTYMFDPVEVMTSEVASKKESLQTEGMYVDENIWTDTFKCFIIIIIIIIIIQ